MQLQASVEGLATHLRLEIGEFYRGLKRIHVIDALDLSEAAGTGMGQSAAELFPFINYKRYITFITFLVTLPKSQRFSQGFCNKPPRPSFARPCGNWTQVRRLKIVGFNGWLWPPKMGNNMVVIIGFDPSPNWSKKIVFNHCEKRGLPSKDKHIILYFARSWEILRGLIWAIAT